MNKKKEKIIFMGNSIVNGFPHKRSQCFVSLYRQHTGHEVINKGVNGETTQQALERLEKDVLRHIPDQMFFLGGTNDFIYQTCQPEETLELMKVIVDITLSSNIRPTLMTPLMIDAEMAARYWIPGLNYHNVANQLLCLRELMLQYGKEAGIDVIDTQDMFLNLYSENNKALYLKDGLHPTVLGHQAIADYLCSIV